MPAFITGANSTSPPSADMQRAPHEAWVWEPGPGPEIVISWSFGTSFDRAFPGRRYHDQVRLAFRTWQDAAITSAGAQSYYRRDHVGWAEFGDLRSVVLHELGHILGFHHVEAQFEHRFYTWDPGPGFLEGSANTSMVMASSGVQSGSYNHILSHDELLGVGLLYSAGVTTEAPRRLRFREVPLGDPAQLVVTVGRLTGPTGPFAWARATGFVRTGAVSGRTTFRIIAGIVQINEDPPQPVGMRTRFDSWTYVPRSPVMRIDSIELRTRGTNNPDPLAVNLGPFSSFTTAPYGPDFKDDLLHTWSVPMADTRRGAEFGLELDVYDWIVVEGFAVVVDAGGTSSRVPLPLATFFESGIVDPEWVPSPPAPGFALDPNRKVIARGIKIVGAGAVSKIATAAVTDENLLLTDLTKASLVRLRKKAAPLEGLPHSLTLKSADSDPCVVLFTTSRAARKNLKGAIVLNRPDLLNGEVLLTAGVGDDRFKAHVATVLGRGVSLPVVVELDDRSAGDTRLRLSVHGGAGLDLSRVDPESVKVAGARVVKVSTRRDRIEGRHLIVDVNGVPRQRALRLLGRTKGGTTFEGTVLL